MVEALEAAFEKLTLKSSGNDDAGLRFSVYARNFSNDEMCVIEGNTCIKTERIITNNNDCCSLGNNKAEHLLEIDCSVAMKDLD